jgi:hypothetical protein
VALFGFSTGTKSEKLNFYSSNILNLPLVPVLNPKSTTFLPLVQVQSPKKSKKIVQKNFFLGIGTGPNTLFFDLNKFLKNF